MAGFPEKSITIYCKVLLCDSAPKYNNTSISANGYVIDLCECLTEQLHWLNISLKEHSNHLLVRQHSNHLFSREE